MRSGNSLPAGVDPRNGALKAVKPSRIIHGNSVQIFLASRYLSEKVEQDIFIRQRPRDIGVWAVGASKNLVLRDH